MLSLCWQVSDHTDIFLRTTDWVLFEQHSKSSPLCHVIPTPTKRRSYRDHRFRDVISPRVYDTWASTPLEHWGVTGRAPKTRESRRRRRRGGGVWGGAVPLPRKFMNFSSQNCVIWCILGVLFLRFMCPMDCSLWKLYRNTSLCLTNDTDWQVHVSTNFLGGRQHRTTPAGQILGVATPATYAALTPMGITWYNLWSYRAKI